MSRELYAPAAVTTRLLQIAAIADLRIGRRLATKIDMTPQAITRRLRQQSDLRDSCLALAGRATESPSNDSR